MARFEDSIFWVDVEKIEPNPYQPRKEFSEAKLRELAESIRAYGVLQPLVVTRKEVERDDGGLSANYELVAGERRLRASKLAGLLQVPVVIRTDEESDRMKLEIAIIENIQREDLNPIDRALAFKRLVDEFHIQQADIASKLGRSREYISNTLRLLQLPQEVIDAIQEGKITEGHGRSLLMLSTRPEELQTLFRETVLKKLSVRDVERISRKIANERIRKKNVDLELVELEKKLTDVLGTRVQIEKRDVGGKLIIDYFSPEDLEKFVARVEGDTPAMPEASPEQTAADGSASAESAPDDRSKEEKEGEDPELYAIRNFSL